MNFAAATKVNLDTGSMKGVMDNVADMGIFIDEKSKNSSLELKLQSQGLTTHREIQRHRFYSNGDNMNLNRYRHYIVKIRENIFVEEDPNQNCRNYPTSEFASYKECDDHYVRRRIDQIAPGLNLTPIWMTDNLDMVTTLPQSINVLAI